MLTIRGERVGGGIQVGIASERDAQLVQAEVPGCRFVATCGCGFSQAGTDGVKLFRLAQKHATETGHRTAGHFMFEAGR